MRVEHLAAISGKGFISAVSRQRHGHILTRQGAHPPCWQSGCISKRLIKHACQSIDRAKIIIAHGARPVVRFEQSSDLLGIGCFIHRADIKADGARLHRRL